MKRSTILIALLAGLAAAPAVAQSQLIDGEVTKIDAAGGKITLRHGPIPKLDMDMGMTMVFRVASPDLLSGVKVGDKIKFDADRTNGQFTVIKIEKAK